MCLCEGRLPPLVYRFGAAARTSEQGVPDELLASSIRLLSPQAANGSWSGKGDFRLSFVSRGKRSATSIKFAILSASLFVNAFFSTRHDQLLSGRDGTFIRQSPSSPSQSCIGITQRSATDVTAARMKA